MDEEHVRILRQGGVEWNRFREQNPGIRPDFYEADLSGLALSRAILFASDFSHANLVGTSLTEADLTEAKLIRTDLTGAHLAGADLTDTELSTANLSGADLTRAKFIRANLVNTDLSKADLSGADLSGADLSRADLSGADLTGAGLSEADLSGTRLTGALLTETYFAGTTIADVDLTKVEDLVTCEHGGPSSIDHLTLKYGPLPKKFLQGCGLQDWEIEAANLHYTKQDPGVTDIIYRIHNLRIDQAAISFYSCFISYSHTEEDKRFARKLHDALQERGIRCWLDEHQLLPGDKIFDLVDRGIRLWDKVLLCGSKAALTSWWVDNEIETTFQKEQKLSRERGERVNALIPLNLDGFMFSDEWKNGYAAQVKSRLAADFTGWENGDSVFSKQFERLIKALQTDDSGREPAPEPKL